MSRSAAAFLATGLLLGGLVLGVSVGPADPGLGALLRVLQGGGERISRDILLEIRVPRAVTASLTGAALAVSGVVFQALLRNPLAEPYLLGVSSGAALGAVLALALGGAWFGPATLPVAALGGALLAIGVVFRVARVAKRLDTRVLVLAGVVVAAFFSACVMLVLTFASAETTRSALLWTMGSLDGASWRAVAVLAAYTVPATGAVWAMGRHLNALALGEETAAILGTEVERVKRGAYFVASLLAAAAVSVAGVIGFVGLVVPHAVRIAWGTDHRGLVPLSFLVGGALLVIADAAARTVAAPVEIPVGVVTAILGVPFFLLLLRRSLVR